MAAWDLLNVVRLNAMLQALQDVREMPADLIWVARTETVPSLEGEIMGRFVGRVTIADIVSDDAAAVVYSSDKVTTEKTSVPNLKHGRSLSQDRLNQLQALQANAGTMKGASMFEDYLRKQMDAILLGIRQRKELLVLSMLLDGFSYDRFGIKMTNVTWGMPADLKVTPSTPWTTAASATPISDILTLLRVARVRYGQVFNRITMSRVALDLITATTEFQNKAKIVLNPGIAVSQLPTQNTDFMRDLVGSLVGCQIELYDSRYWEQTAAGVIQSAPYLPIDKVLFTSTLDDNDPEARDFASGIVTESVVGSLVPGLGMLGQSAGPSYGPFGYATAPSQMNPPNLNLWGVERGFPRKHRLQSSAVLDIGSPSESIAVGEPF